MRILPRWARQSGSTSAALLSAGGQDDPLTTLSEREHAVLTLMAEGLTNTGLAQRLFVSERTIEGHVRHIMIKLDPGRHHSTSLSARRTGSPARRNAMTRLNTRRSLID